MKRTGMPFTAVVLAFLLGVPALAQQEERTRPASVNPQSSGQVRELAGGAQAAAPSIASRGVATTNAASSPGISTVRDTGRNQGIFTDNSQGARSYVSAAPDLKGSSFYSAGSYFSWERFYYNLSRQYFLNPQEFARFYHNREPLMTPRIQKAALRQSLGYSARMVEAVEELETLVDALQSGEAVDKNEIIGKAREIRELAKQIRKDPLLHYADQRQDRDVLRGRDKELKQLGLDAFEELRQMVVDVNTQMTSMHRETRTATISLDTLSQPSFDSLSKGIERLSKVIEDSAKRL